MSNSLHSLIELVTNPLTSRPEYARVCAHCEKEHNESAFLNSYLRNVNRGQEVPVSHGICPNCFNREMEKLKIA